MPVVLKNNAKSTLGAGIGTTDTQLTVTTGTGDRYPDPAAGEWFPLTLVKQDGTLEVTRATDRSGDTISIQRAQEGTAAVSFAAGDRVELRLTAAVTKDIDDRARDAENLSAGSLPGTRFTDLSHGDRGGGDLHPNVTDSAAGFMSPAQKTKLDAVGTMANRNITLSTGLPTGGVNGDIWFQHEA